MLDVARARLVALFLTLAVLTVPLAAQPAGYSELAAAQAAANGQPGARKSPAHTSPVPTDEVSAEEQKLIGNPYPPHFNADPMTAQEWKDLVNARAKLALNAVPAMKEKFGVTVEPTTISGVKSFIVTPGTMPDANRNRLLVHVHGGGYVFSPGEAALPEAILLSGIGGFKVISVDYRMPPDFPYPAAMDDAMAVWKEAVKMADPRNMAIFGTSTGGAMTLAMVLRAKAENLPLPAAIAPGTPWADISKIGDTYETNEWVDNVLVTWDGWLGRAAKLYANGHDLKDPFISPIYGDFSGFPPTILTSGTRDLFLSNTVRTHRKLRRAGVEADLNVYEGQSHGQYGANMNAPETKEASPISPASSTGISANSNPYCADANALRGRGQKQSVLFGLGS
jgi:acetyl esterase/lipase